MTSINKKKKAALKPRRKTQIKHTKKANYDKYVAHCLRRFEDCATKNIIVNEMVQMGCPLAEADSIVQTVSELYLQHDPEEMIRLFSQLRLANSRMLQHINSQLDQAPKDPTWHALKIKVLENMRKLLPDQSTITIKTEDDLNKVFFDVHNLNEEE